MINQVSDEAQLLFDVLREQLADAGGLDIRRNAAVDAPTRQIAGELLAEAGVWELQPGEDGDQLEAAAVACQAAGGVVLPYPVCERLTGAARGRATALVSSRESRRLVEHGDLDLEWDALDMTGQHYRLKIDSGSPLGTSMGGWLVEATADIDGAIDRPTATLALVLQSWWMLGACQTALADTLQYTREREQFGRPLVKFQAVQFSLADMSVAVAGLDELAKHALWSLREYGGEALSDALGLRLRALEVASLVFRSGQQLHGAMGFTDEVDLSWITRAIQVYRRLPEPADYTAQHLVREIARSDYRGATEWKSEDAHGD
jgi:hypothetical protein